jgi:hypothetical protein
MDHWSRVSRRRLPALKLRNGKLLKFQQYTDTLQVAKAMGA